MLPVKNKCPVSMQYTQFERITITTCFSWILVEKKSSSADESTCPFSFVFFRRDRKQMRQPTCGSNGRQLEANWIIKCFSIYGLNRSGGVGSAGGGGLNEPLYRNVFQRWWVVEYVQMDEKEETLSLDRSVMTGVQMSRQLNRPEKNLVLQLILSFLGASFNSPSTIPMRHFIIL